MYTTPTGGTPIIGAYIYNAITLWILLFIMYHLRRDAAAGILHYGLLTSGSYVIDERSLCR